MPVLTRLARTGPQQAVDVLVLPRRSALEMPKLALAAHELGWVQERSPAALNDRNHVVQELVINDVGDEVARHPGLIEHRVDAHETFDGTVAAELDALARASALVRRT